MKMSTDYNVGRNNNNNNKKVHIIYRQKINQISPAIMSKYKLKFILPFYMQKILKRNYMKFFFISIFW